MSSLCHMSQIDNLMFSFRSRNLSLESMMSLPFSSGFLCNFHSADVILSAMCHISVASYFSSLVDEVSKVTLHSCCHVLHSDNIMVPFLSQNFCVNLIKTPWTCSATCHSLTASCFSPLAETFV